MTTDISGYFLLILNLHKPYMCICIIIGLYWLCKYGVFQCLLGSSLSSIDGDICKTGTCFISSLTLSQFADLRLQVLGQAHYFPRISSFISRGADRVKLASKHHLPVRYSSHINKGWYPVEEFSWSQHAKNISWQAGSQAVVLNKIIESCCLVLA